MQTRDEVEGLHNCREFKKAVASFDQNSKVAGHVHLFGHNMNFENLKMFGIQYHERLFLEAWHSTLDPNSGNDHILRLEAYKGIARAWITWSRAQASCHVTFNSVWQRISLSFHWTSVTSYQESVANRFHNRYNTWSKLCSAPTGTSYRGNCYFESWRLFLHLHTIYQRCNLGF